MTLNGAVRSLVSIELSGMAPDGTALRLVIRDAKLIARRSGDLVLQMPDQPHRDSCHACGKRMSLTQKFCGECGCALPPLPDRVAMRGLKDCTPADIHWDVVLPTDSVTRQYLTAQVIAEYERWQADAAKASPRRGWRWPSELE